jgi:2-methylisocitrate lyase-like PEP mutase family enzyme
MMLRDLLAGPELLMVPGAWDGLSAALVEQAGFPAVFLSGASLAYARLGRPDFGFATASELADACARMTERVAIPVLADADQGYGGTMQLQRTVRMLEQAGAAAVQIEDQWLVKPLDALASRPLVPVQEMLGRIRAAQDARRGGLLISARTDAQADVPWAESLERALAYVEAGCDLLLVEGLSEAAHAAELVAAVGGRVPLIHNLLEGGRSPYATAAEVAEAGFRVALFAGSGIGTVAHALQGMLAAIRADGATLAVRDRMMTAGQVGALMGAGALAEKAKGFR